MPTTFDDIKREELQTTLAARQEEFAAVQDQIRSTLSAIDQKKLERQASHDRK